MPKKNIFQKHVKPALKFAFGLLIGIVISNITILAFNIASSSVSYNSNIELSTQTGLTDTNVASALNTLYDIHSYGNATASDIIKGKTAYVNGEIIMGTMTNRASSTVVATNVNTSNVLYVKPYYSGYYSTASSLNTGILYNPNGTGTKTQNANVAYAGTGLSTNVLNQIVLLDQGIGVNMPAGYYTNQVTFVNDYKVAIGSFSWTNASTVSVNVGFKPEQLTIRTDTRNVINNYNANYNATRFTFSNNATSGTNTALNNTSTYRLKSIDDTGFTVNKWGVSTAATGYYIAIAKNDAEFLEDY